MKITTQFLDENQSIGTVLSRRQAEILGVEFPCRKGWRKQLLGRELDEYTALEFIQAKEIVTVSSLTGIDRVFAEAGLKTTGLLSEARPIRTFRAPAKVGVCGKQIFGSEGQCRQAITNRLNKATDTTRLISYFCNRCHGWHMSSRTSRRDR